MEDFKIIICSVELRNFLRGLHRGTEDAAAAILPLQEAGKCIQFTETVPYTNKNRLRFFETSA